MALRKLGPFSNSDIDEIRAILDEHGFTYEVVYPSRDEMAEIRLNKRRSYDLPPRTYSGNLEFIYIEVELAYNQLLPEALDKYGVALGSLDFDPEFHKKEYLCPRCGHVGRLEITCPKHQLKLISFEEYTSRRTRRQRRLFLILLILAMGASFMMGRAGHR